jgi:hypothetical protein
MKAIKNLPLVATLVWFASLPPAWGGPVKDYKFHFSYGGKRLEVIESASNWEQSYEKAALKCLSYFSQGKPLTHEKGLDLVDVCANPKS